MIKRKVMIHDDEQKGRILRQRVKQDNICNILNMKDLKFEVYKELSYMLLSYLFSSTRKHKYIDNAISKLRQKCLYHIWANIFYFYNDMINEFMPRDPSLRYGEGIYGVYIYMDIINGLEFPWYNPLNYIEKLELNSLFTDSERKYFMNMKNEFIDDDDYFSNLFFPKDTSYNSALMYNNKVQSIARLPIYSLFKLVQFIKVEQSVIKDAEGHSKTLYFKSDLKSSNGYSYYIELAPLETYDFGNNDITIDIDSKNCIEDLIEELKFYNVQLYQSDNVSNIVPQYNIRHTIYGSDKFCYFL